MTDTEKVTLSREIAEELTAQGILVPAWMKEVFFCPACENYSYSDWNYTAKSGAWCNKCGEGQLALVPVDFTSRLYLIPAVKAWIARQPVGEGWTYEVAWCEGQGVANIYELVDQDWGRYYSAADKEDEMVALAQAFQKALKAGKEQAND